MQSQHNELQEGKMSHAIELHRPDMGLFGRLSAARDAMRQHSRQAKTYRTTRHELSIMSDRDLADIGLSRGDIENISLQAAMEV